MAIKEVIKMGHPTLRKVAEKVDIEALPSQEIDQLVQDLFDTMEKEGGIGIAAPQINVSLQVAIVGIPSDNPRYEDLDIEEIDDFEPLVVINPEIKILDEAKQGFWEGCLSVPGLRGYVERPKKVEITFYNPEGKQMQIEAEGFMATVFQHELDHLFGKLYVDRVSDITKLSYIDEYLEFHEEEE